MQPICIHFSCHFFAWDCQQIYRYFQNHILYELKVKFMNRWPWVSDVPFYVLGHGDLHEHVYILLRMSLSGGLQDSALAVAPDLFLSSLRFCNKILCMYTLWMHVQNNIH